MSPTPHKKKKKKKFLVKKYVLHLKPQYLN